jgi:hypothetical protein
MSKRDFNPNNLLSVLLPKIGKGTADTDFARAVGLANDRIDATNKKAKIIVTIEIEPRDEEGARIMRANVEARLPKLAPPSTQMHVADDGAMATQMELWVMGGPAETAPAPIPAKPTPSGRLPVAAAPAPAPIAPAPAPKPLAGKDAAAGKDA